MRFNILVYAFSLCIILPIAAKADVKVKLEFTSIEERVDPDQLTYSTARRYTFIISKDHKIRMSYKSPSHDEKLVELQFEKPSQGRTQAGTENIYRVRLEDNSIIYAFFAKTWKLILTAHINNNNTCDASVKYELLPGYQYFEAHIENNTYLAKDKTYRAVNVNCSVSEVN